MTTTAHSDARHATPEEVLADVERIEERAREAAAEGDYETATLLRTEADARRQAAWAVLTKGGQAA